MPIVGELVVFVGARDVRAERPPRAGRELSVPVVAQLVQGRVYTVEAVRAPGEIERTSNIFGTIGQRSTETMITLVEVQHRIPYAGRVIRIFIPARWFVPLRDSKRIDTLREHLSQGAIWGAHRKEEKHADA